jgi:DNA mismatch endonuclease (patch repair protein)
LHAAGYRYRVTYPVPGLPRRSIDVAFTRAKVAVFVDGCFWHGCPEHGTSPRANSAWWRAKIEANRARDRDTSARLAEQGWRVMRVWEHDPLDEKLVAIQSVLESLGTTHCCDGLGDHRRH